MVNDLELGNWGYWAEMAIKPVKMLDRVLAAHYTFTHEKLDFIPSTRLRAGINYDIKYRMGRDTESEKE